MEVNELPTYLLKPFPKSRVRNHVQTMMFMQLVRGEKADQRFELAICENVISSRTFYGGNWGKWEDTKHDSHEKALKELTDLFKTQVSRGFVSLTSEGLLLPLNETDVRHLRDEFMLPRSALTYGSELYDAITTWFVAERAKAMTAAPPTPAMPPAAPTASTMPVPATHGGAPTSLTVSEDEGFSVPVSELLRKLSRATDDAANATKGLDAF